MMRCEARKGIYNRRDYVIKHRWLLRDTPDTRRLLYHPHEIIGGAIIYAVQLGANYVDGVS